MSVVDFGWFLCLFYLVFDAYFISDIIKTLTLGPTAAVSEICFSFFAIIFLNTRFYGNFE